MLELDGLPKNESHKEKGLLGSTYFKIENQNR